MNIPTIKDSLKVQPEPSQARCAGAHGSPLFMPTITKQVIAFGELTLIGCDAQCSKAWGINNRPKVQLSKDEDDYAFLADGELGEAPENPGTYEGGHAKPTQPDERLNKWCFRECERCASARVGQPLKYPNLLTRLYNVPTSDPANDQGQPPRKTT